MQVSAISMFDNIMNYNGLRSNSFNTKTEQIGDTSFNSLTPYLNKVTESKEKLPEIYKNINEWKNFCHDRIMGKKLDIIA